MTTRIPKSVAGALLREAVHAAQSGSGCAPEWEARFQTLGRLCDAPGSSKTHLAFVCTVLLAKATSPEAVDLRAIKPAHAVDNPKAWSARTLCHGVVVPVATELGIDIGVTGREPLNNQPYFRMRRLGDGTPVHSRARAAFQEVLSLVDAVQGLTGPEARTALFAFVRVQLRQPVGPEPSPELPPLTPAALAAHITSFTAEDSEHGLRAQAAAAALFSAAFGPERVTSGRIHDPSRNHPGDICIRASDDELAWEKAVEVRDKPVQAADVRIFVRRCLRSGVQHAAMVTASRHQAPLDELGLEAWAAEQGATLTLFPTWLQLVEQAAFWARLPPTDATRHMAHEVHRWLAALGAHPRSIDRWHTRLRSTPPAPPRSAP